MNKFDQDHCNGDSADSIGTPQCTHVHEVIWAMVNCTCTGSDENHAVSIFSDCPAGTLLQYSEMVSCMPKFFSFKFYLDWALE